MGTTITNSKNTQKDLKEEGAGYMAQMKEKFLGDDPVKAVEDFGVEIKEAAQDRLEKASLALDRSRKEMVRAVQDRPLSAVAIAFGAGAVASLATTFFLSRRNNKR